MKIDVKRLKEFIEKATLNATIQAVLIKIEDKKMVISMKSTDNVCAVTATLKNVESDNAVWGIKDTRLLLNCLKLFSGAIELKQDNNKLYIFNKEKQVEITLAAENFIDNVLNKPMNLTYEKKILIPSTIFKNALTNKKTISGEKIIVESNETTLTVTTGSKNFDAIKETISVPYVNARVGFAAGFDEVVTALGDKVEVGLKSDYPAMFKEDSAEYEITYVLAPTMIDEAK